MELIRINPGKGVNNIEFGAGEELLKNLDYPRDVLNVEFKNEKVVSVSFRNLFQFYIDEMLVDLEYTDQWLQKENPHFDGSCYIFPELNIAAFGLSNRQAGFEITAYAKVIEPLYEKDIERHSRYADLQKQALEHSPGFDISPYSQCGPLRFGTSSAGIKELMGTPQHTGYRGSDTLILQWDNCVMRFINDRLVQVTLENESSVFLNGENINKTGPKANVFALSEKFSNRAYTVLFEFGISFSGFDKPREAKTIIVFDEAMKSFWQNTKRPLI